MQRAPLDSKAGLSCKERQRKEDLSGGILDCQWESLNQRDKLELFYISMYGIC